ncbi:oligogalacturonate lyase family protein [Saliphagus sp. LR7]|uniref:oligogalacturonate lyase family protein n=1 Tax=Saliphagus sp. LR7 TaxID=2282654 RepID=UPI000DF83B4D|nr:oligogalacturonate lyase family protein [Saliphagus sp. LR7]
MDTALRQGPAAGTERPAEWSEYDDPETGATVTRLTDTADSGNWHLYFTENGWDDGGRRLLIRSDRTGSRQLHSVDLETGEITQLTDLPHPIDGVTRAGERALFWCGDRLAVLKLDSLRVRELYERPEGYGGSHTAGTADGERVVVAIAAETEFNREFENRGAWIKARMDANPHSQIISVPIAGGEPTVHVEDERWLNHVNASPTRPDLVTYCEEGPWEAVDRIRVLDLASGEQWRARPTDEGEAVGHEYWLADGEHVGYHGWRGTRDEPDPFFGRVRYDGTDRREWPAPDLYTHVHSNGPERVVCDGTHRGAPFDLLWERREEDGGDGRSEEYTGPWKLAHHGWESDDDAHPHSRLSPDDSQVVFDASEDDADAGSDVYLVEVPDDVTELPRFDLEGFEPATDR